MRTSAAESERQEKEVTQLLDHFALEIDYEIEKGTNLSKIAAFYNDMLPDLCVEASDIEAALRRWE